MDENNDKRMLSCVARICGYTCELENETRPPRHSVISY